jgi:ribosomal protein S18 acetylase RimI-like enzyme
MIFAGRMPYTTEADGIGLKRLSARDIPLVREGLREAGWSGSLFRTWLRLRQVFAFLYVVEISSRPAGIFGVYNFAPGSSAEISLMIFDEPMRRKGYGKKIFSMAADMLSRRAAIKRLWVMVDPENGPASAFWTGLGFRDDHSRGKYRICYLDLNAGTICRSPAP